MSANPSRTFAARSPSTLDRPRLAGGTLPGVVLSGVLAALSIELARLDGLRANGIGALTLAIVLGMLVGNTVYPRLAATAAPGVTFSKQRLLRLGIVLYGLRLTFQDIARIGVAGATIDALVLASTFGVACFVGTRWLGLDRRIAMLIGAGSAICGATAVMAAEPVVRGRSEQVTVAVSTVVVFGTLAMFLYPVLYRLNLAWHVVSLSPATFGLYAGSTIHEVAQVVAAGNAVSPEAADAAVIAKMVRVMMLAPFLVGLSAWLARAGSAADGEPAAPPAASRRLAVPWFAFGFVAVAGLNSLDWLPADVVRAATDLDTVMLAMAMAALGLTTHVSAIRRAGLRPLVLAGVLAAWLMGAGLAINAGVRALAG